MDAYLLLGKEETEDSVSTQTYYNKDYTDSTADSTHKHLLPSCCNTRSRSNSYSYQDLLVDPIHGFQALKSMLDLNPDQAFKIFKEIFHKNSRDMLEAIKYFEILRGMGLREDHALQILKDKFYEKKKRSRKNLKEEDEYCIRKTYSSCSEETEKDTNTNKPMMKKQKRISELLVEEDDLRGSNSSYVCKECNAAFEDYRALGGHMASHNRKKREKLGIETVNGGGSIEEKKSYKCNLCPRSFTTGQALGGHKTYHRKIAQLEAISSGKAPQLELDLNLPPADEWIH